MILTRHTKLKRLALEAKKNNDKPTALEYMKRIKLCEHLAEKWESDQSSVTVHDLPSLDLNQQPPSAMETAKDRPQPPPVPPAVTKQFSHDTPIEVPANPNEIPPPDPEVFGAPPAPATIKEALTQRLNKYKSEESKAKEAGNSSKARRMGRIVKQYEEALKLHSMGRPFPRAELPNPPGFAAIPLADNKQPTAAASGMFFQNYPWLTRMT